MKHKVVEYAAVLFAREAQRVLKGECLTCTGTTAAGHLFCEYHKELGYALLDNRVAKEKAPTP